MSLDFLEEVWLRLALEELSRVSPGRKVGKGNFSLPSELPCELQM